MEGYDRKNAKAFKNIMVSEPLVFILEVDEKYQKYVYDYNSEIKYIFKKTYNPYLENTQSFYYDIDSLGIDKDSLLRVLNRGFISNRADSVFVESIKNININAEKLLLLEIDGFYKTKELVNWEGTKSVLWAIFTLGTYVPIYPEYGTALYAVMIDLKNNKVVYKENYRFRDDPRVVETIENIVKKTLLN
jgi:hypothetical protein